MKKRVVSSVATIAILLSIAPQIPASAQSAAASAAVTVPVSGSIARGEFSGTATINRFEQRGNQIVAIGMVTGVLSRGGRTLGSVVAGQVTWPVAVKVGGQLLASSAARPSGMPMPVAFSPAGAPSIRLVQAETCQVVDIALGPVNVDVLGFQIALSPIALNLSGVVDTPLGDLVCSVSDLLGNVAGLVDLLNSILGLLTGLLGGLTGGLGGGVPIP